MAGDRGDITKIYLTPLHADHLVGLITILGAFIGAGPSPRPPSFPKHPAVHPDLLQLWSVIFTDFALSEEEIVAPDETNGADW